MSAVPPTYPISFKDVFLQDFWVHVAGVIAIGFGVADIVYFHALAHDSDLLFIIGGFGAMGLKFVNGSAAALRTAALDTAFSAARIAQVAAAASAGVPVPSVLQPTITVTPVPPVPGPGPSGS